MPPQRIINMQADSLVVNFQNFDLFGNSDRRPHFLTLLALLGYSTTSPDDDVWKRAHLQMPKSCPCSSWWFCVESFRNETPSKPSNPYTSSTCPRPSLGWMNGLTFTINLTTERARHHTITEKKESSAYPNTASRSLSCRAVERWRWQSSSIFIHYFQVPVPRHPDWVLMECLVLEVFPSTTPDSTWLAGPTVSSSLMLSRLILWPHSPNELRVIPLSFRSAVRHYTTPQHCFSTDCAFFLDSRHVRTSTKFQWIIFIRPPSIAEVIFNLLAFYFELMLHYVRHILVWPMRKQ